MLGNVSVYVYVCVNICMLVYVSVYVNVCVNICMLVYGNVYVKVYDVNTVYYVYYI
jgi:hypothetical protein